MRRPVVLIGFMGSGKTTLARALAERLGVQAADTDDLVEQDAGARIDDIWAREGEEGFRAREASALRRALQDGVAVIATGAGAVTYEESYALLEQAATVVYLRAPLDELWARAARTSGRPNAQDEERFRTLHEERRARYERLAHVMVSTTDPPEQVAETVVQFLGG